MNVSQGGVILRDAGRIAYRVREMRSGSGPGCSPRSVRRIYLALCDKTTVRVYETNHADSGFIKVSS